MLGQVTIDDDTLAENADFHVYKAIWNHDPDPLAVAENIAFIQLRDGVTGEASRHALRKTVVDRLIPEIIRRPDRALGLITTLDGSGFSFDELRRVCLRRVLWRSRGAF